MIAAIIQGVLLGMLLSVFIGPVFFLLIETSIKYGVRRAYVMDAGVILSDVLWIILLYFGVDTYLGAFLNSPAAKFISGVVIIIFGLSSLFILKRHKTIKLMKKKRIQFVEGFLLNSINPSVALFWLGTLTVVIPRFNDNRSLIFVFFVAAFLTIAVIDTFKFVMAKKLRPFLNDKRQYILSVITSSILITFGIYMIFSRFR